MVMCWAPDCKHYNQRETCSFFKFPKDPKERNRWKNLTRRDVEPGPGAFLCSCHFRDGKRENGPEIFLHNVSKKFTFTSPQKRKRRVLGLEAQQHLQGPSAKRQLEGLFELEPESRPPPSEMEMSVVDEPSSAEMSVLDDLPGPSQPSTSVEPQPGCSKENTPPLSTSSVVAEAENYLLKKKIEDLEREMENLKVQFSFNHIEDNDRLILLYTGLPNAAIFLALYNLLENIEINYYSKWKVERISRIDQLLMCLMKLRQNFPHGDIAQRFQISETTVSNVITTWIHVLHEILFKQLMCSIPSRNKTRTCLPTCFSTFTNCRIILDCTEMATVTSRSSMETQRATYSSYKHCNTWKALIGVAPNGIITFISNLYPGSTSDKKIVEDSGVLNVLQLGDLILADKGFLLKDILPPGVHINIPPFLTTPQFTPAQVQQTESIARARIHVERAIRRVKCFKILKFLPFSLIPHADAVIQVVGALTNLQFPLIREVEKFYSSDDDE